MQSEDEKTVKTAIPSVDEINARLSQPMKDPLIGTKIAGGRYEILDVLGEGGMSVVYKAKQELVDRIVAIKTLRMPLLSDPNLIKRFDREIKTLSRLNHPNIVTVFDCVLGDNGQPYFVMDYLQGFSLQDLLNEEQREHHRISAGRAKNIFVQVCNAVDHAHRNGITHRDLKPANIMLMDISGQEFVKVVDFGLAKIGEEAQRITQTGEIWGSPLYMSPEQCSGLEMDPRSDIYSLGAVMYECLTGSVPISGKTFLETIQKVVGQPVPPFAQMAPDLSLPGGIEKIVLRCLEKNPDDRFQTMAELKDAIERSFPADEEALMRTLPPGKMGVDKAAALATKELNRDAQSLIPTARLRRDATGADSAAPAKASVAKPAQSKSPIAKPSPPAKSVKKSDAPPVNPLIASIVGGLIVALAFIIVFLVVQSVNQQPAPPPSSATAPAAPIAAPAPATVSSPTAGPAAPSAPATPVTTTTSAPATPAAAPSTPVTAAPAAPTSMTPRPALTTAPVKIEKTEVPLNAVSHQSEVLKSEQPKSAGKSSESLSNQSFKPVVQTPQKPQHKVSKPVVHHTVGATSESAHPRSVAPTTDKEVWEGLDK